MSHLDELVVKICELSEEELRHLNRVTVERIRLLNKQRTFQASLNFRVLQKVKIARNKLSRKSWHLLDREGTILKCNKSKALIDFGENERWDIPYTMLELV